MKTTLIFTALFFFAAFMGCSENQSVTDPFSFESGLTKNPGSPSVEVIWKLKELTVNTNVSFTDQYENRATFINQPLTMISGYQITFDVYTNADKFTNGYIPLVNISRDGDIEFSSSEFPGADGSDIAHVTVELNNVRFNELEVFIALFQSDNIITDTDDNGVTLKLTDITLYRMN